MKTETIDSAKRIPRRIRRGTVLKRARDRELAALWEKYTEGLNLIVPTTKQEEFLSCLKKIRIGEGSNRSLKSSAGAIDCARCVTNQDPYDKFPAKGSGLIVALDWQPHISELWGKMTREGEFKTIRDERTGLPRAVRPDPKDPTRIDPYDEAYREKWRDGAPLIPPGLIERVNFESTAPPTPRWARFTTGWEIDFRSSKSTAVQGKHYGFGWFDEQLKNEQFYYEAMRGLVALHETARHKPRFWWTATSQITNAQYFELSEQATAGSDFVESFLFLIKDNPFITQDEKQAFHDSLPPDERAARYFGIHARVAKRIYGGFDASGVHGCEPFEVPTDWARYVALDPGRQYCATIFAAVPPDEVHTYIYDGFLMRNEGAKAWAGMVSERQRDTKFEAFVIDQVAGQQHGMGNEDNEGVADKFWDALVEVGVQPNQICRSKWAGFFPGTKDIRAREESLKGWMAIRGAGPGMGTPKLQIFRGTLPDLEKQVRFACMDSKNPERRAEDRPEDLLAALEYMAHFDPGYAAPEPLYKPRVGSAVLADWKEQQRLERHQRMSQHLLANY